MALILSSYDLRGRWWPPRMPIFRETDPAKAATKPETTRVQVVVKSQGQTRQGERQRPKIGARNVSEVGP